MMKKLNTVFILLCALLALSFGSASAFPLWPGGFEPQVGEIVAGTQFEDDNLDYHVDNDQPGTPGFGLITPGDYLFSAVEFGQVVDIFAPGNPAYTLDRANDELVAIALIQYLGDNPVTGDWLFGPIGNTPMISVYTGGAINLDLTTAGLDPTLQNALNAVTDGNFLWAFSLDAADPDTFWSFSPDALPGGGNPADPVTVWNLPTVTKVGTVNFQLNQVLGDDVFNQHFGLTLPGGDGYVDLIGSGDIIGGLGLKGPNNPLIGAFARSDTDASVNPIPEPTTMSLLGFGLLGLASLNRRRSRRKK